jgi:hypothetical protein
MTDAQAADLQKPPVTVDAAVRLADFYGVCLQNTMRQEKWLRVAADSGDLAAMKSLASIVERQPGRAAEGARLREEIAKREIRK